jgi:hypothetical protein
LHENIEVFKALKKTCFILFILFWVISFSFAQDNHHGDIDINCDACHLTEGWDRLKPTLDFDHDIQTNFPLEGRHHMLGCSECHISLVFSEAGSNCFDCHEDIHEGQFADQCSECHTPSTWDNRSEMSMRHLETRFPLVGVHDNFDCQVCHASGQYVNLPINCGGCHVETFLATVNPNHQAADFSTDCSQCHSQNIYGWKSPTYQHTQNFPLTGSHRVDNCLECHSDNQYSVTSSECYSCHQNDYESADEPNHVTGQYNLDCEICHSLASWTPSTFSHDETQFPLGGAHQIVDCFKCHENSQYEGTGTDCFSCHDNDYDGTEEPNHSSGQFDHDCTLCHTDQAWTPSTFDHEITDFPLLGAHQIVSCELCHIDGQYVDIDFECFSCHETDYEEVEDPNHVLGEFDLDCSLCHSNDAFTPSTFDHDITDFQLLGAHQTVSCELCHINDQYSDLPSDCYSCHDDDYSGVNDPNHVSGDFDHDCSICHSNEAWTPAVFDHDATDFPLLGAHQTVNCQLCHVDGQYNGLPSDCYSCHDNDFIDVEDPNHVTEQFDHDCTQCHSNEAWTPANFDHVGTEFPLTGAHMTLNCLDCHLNGQYSGTPTECYFCHDDDYEGVSDPDHEAGDFDHDCSICHSTEAWSPADFDHDDTDFPLTGSHQQVDCAACHLNGQYSGTPSACFDCHEDDYNGAEYQGFNHNSENFPHDCEMCHNTTDWDDSDFNHDNLYFPIFSGEHRNEWDHCNDCHLNSNFEIFSCIDCHEHNRPDMDDEHDDVQNYQYLSSACYECHPDGSEDENRFVAPEKLKNIAD